MSRKFKDGHYDVLPYPRCFPLKYWCLHADISGMTCTILPPLGQAVMNGTQSADAAVGAAATDGGGVRDSDGGVSGVRDSSGGVSDSAASAPGVMGVSESDREWMVSDQEDELIRLLSVENLPDAQHLKSDIRLGATDSGSEV